MTLEKAILFAIEQEGIGIISEARFIYYLNDLQAFNMPAVKRIIGTMVSGGYTEKLKNSLATQNYELDINDAKSKLVNIEGFQADLVEYVLNCLLYATKKTTLKPTLPSTSTTSTLASSTTNNSESVKSKRRLLLDPLKGITNPNDPTGNYFHYRFPTLDLLLPFNPSNQKDGYEFLYLREAIASRTFQESKAKLPICLGVSENNDIHVIDLATQPHLLIAGSTGTGKSLFLHAIISSMLYKLGPSELKFVLIDPHRVELSQYRDIEKYYLAKPENSTKAVVSESEDVTSTFKSITQEIENRYQLLEKAGVRDIDDYNKKWKTELRSKLDERGKFYEYLPRIVIIIDEFSSFVQNISNFQNILSNIAGKGRAAGVHLILSTNAVGARLLTPTIKALFPARIAFDVPQAHESQLILDCKGAESINHKGRLIFKNGDIKACLQSPFVGGVELSGLCNFIKAQADADTDKSHKCYLLGQTNDILKQTLPNDRDPLFDEIARLVVCKDMVTTSSLQRSYNIGFNRANRILDQLEAAGIIGPGTFGKPRKVLMDPLDLDNLFNGKQPTAKPKVKPVIHQAPTPLYNGGTTTNNSTPANIPPKKGFIYYLVLSVFGGILIALAIFFAYMLHLMGS